MVEITELPVEARGASGKGGARALRRAGKVPGVVYGDGRDPATIAISTHFLERELAKGGFQNRLYELDLGDRKQRVLPREIQLHPVTDRPLHVDFLRLGADASITVMVPVNFINEEQCEGLRQGGILNVVRYEIEMRCRADAIPESIVVDLSGMEMGDSIHIGAVTLPEGAVPTISDRDFTIATIAVPSVVVEEEAAEGEEVAEGEEGAEAVAEGEGGDAASAEETDKS